MFRLHRDVRFSPDKSPYKTQLGIQFRHRQYRDVHSPSFYLHLEPGGCFAGVGIWRPAGATLARIRAFLVEQPARWRRTLASGPFQQRFALDGERLKRAPKGYDPNHPLIEDLKRKDFVASAPLADSAVTAPGFLDEYTELCRSGAPLVRYLCAAVGAPF
jgi:uncharacterized protein (TIGR02453 family)